MGAGQKIIFGGGFAPPPLPPLATALAAIFVRLFTAPKAAGMVKLTNQVKNYESR